MVSVYGDISGDEASPVMVAACYLGGEHEWSAATTAWREALHDAGVTHFHATDFFSCRRQFKDWTPNDRRHLNFAKRFTAIAVDAGLIGFSFGILCEAFTTILAPVLQAERRRHTSANPRTFVTLMAVNRVARFLSRANHSIAERGRIVFESEAGDQRYADFFEECKERRERFTRYFDTFTSEGKNSVRLQIADLLAHETWRRLKEHFSPSGRPLRKSFERMIAAGRIEVEAFGFAEAQMNADLFRRWLAVHPDGLIRPVDRDVA